MFLLLLFGALLIAFTPLATRSFKIGLIHNNILHCWLGLLIRNLTGLHSWFWRSDNKLCYWFSNKFCYWCNNKLCYWFNNNLGFCYSSRFSLSVSTPASSGDDSLGSSGSDGSLGSSGGDGSFGSASSDGSFGCSSGGGDGGFWSSTYSVGLTETAITLLFCLGSLGCFGSLGSLGFLSSLQLSSICNVASGAYCDGGGALAEPLMSICVEWEIMYLE